MTGNGDGNGGILKTVAIWLVVGVAAIVGLKIALVALGLVARVALFAIFTLGPILLVGWLVLKALRHFTRDTMSPAT